MVSFFLADAAQQAGAVIASGVPVAEIVPGEGVLLDSGERLPAPIVISNADPRTTLRLLGNAADPAWRTRVESIPIEGCTLKLNVWLRELPNFRARPGACQPHHFGQINTLSPSRSGSELHRRPQRPTAAAPLDRTLLPKRARRHRGAPRHSHHERLLAIRALQVCGRHLGRASRSHEATRPQNSCALLQQYPRCRNRRRSAWPSRH